MFIIGRSAPEYTSYSTYLPSMPGLHRPCPASYYPDDSTFDHASFDLDAEWLALERAQQYAHAQERAIHQAQERAYLAEVARVRAREVAQHRMRVEQEELARARAAYRNTLLRDLVELQLPHVSPSQDHHSYPTHHAYSDLEHHSLFTRGRAPRPRPIHLHEFHQSPEADADLRLLQSILGSDVDRQDSYASPPATQPSQRINQPAWSVPTQPRPMEAASAPVAQKGLPDLNAFIRFIRDEASDASLRQDVPPRKDLLSDLTGASASQPPVTGPSSARATQTPPVFAPQDVKPNVFDFLQTLQEAAKDASESSEAPPFADLMFSLLGPRGRPTASQQAAAAPSVTPVPLRASKAAVPPTLPATLPDFVRNIQDAAKGASKPKDMNDFVMSLLGSFAQPAPSAASVAEPSTNGIPTANKGKGKAPASPIAKPRPEVDKQTAAQLEADAAFAAMLQAEEDTLAARSFSKGVRFCEPIKVTPAQGPQRTMQQPNAKTSSTLEQLLQARAVSESDPEVMVAINRLLQTLSPTLSAPPSPVASSSAGPVQSVPAPAAAAAAAPSPSPLTTLNGIASKLATLTSSFALPVALDFSRSSSPAPSVSSASTQLPYTPVNRPAHAYEAALGRLLDQLDAVDVDGNEAVRARRRELVKEVEGALGKLDEAVAAQRVTHAPEVDNHQDETKGYDVEPDTTTSITTSASSSEPAVGLASEDITVKIDDTPAAATTTGVEESVRIEDLAPSDASASDVSTYEVAPVVVQDEPAPTVVLEDVLLPAPIATRPLSTHTFPPGSSPLAIVSSPTDLDEISSSSDAVETEDVDTFLLPAPRVASPVLKSNQSESDEEVVLVKADADKGSDGEWSELDG